MAVIHDHAYARSIRRELGDTASSWGGENRDAKGWRIFTPEERQGAAKILRETANLIAKESSWTATGSALDKNGRELANGEHPSCVSRSLFTALVTVGNPRSKAGIWRVQDYSSGFAGDSWYCCLEALAKVTLADERLAEHKTDNHLERLRQVNAKFAHGDIIDLLMSVADGMAEAVDGPKTAAESPTK